MALVRDIQERGSSSSNAPPKPPSLSAAAGFPTIAHRSQRISAFKRARQESKTAQSGGSSSEPPLVRATSGTAKSELDAAKDRISGAPTSDVAGILASVQEENEAKVKRMSERERRDELEELEMQIPRSVLEMLRARLRKKEEDAAESEEDEEGNEGSGTASDLSDGEKHDAYASEQAEALETGVDNGGSDRLPASKPKVSFNPLLSFATSTSPDPATNLSRSDAGTGLDAASDTQKIHDRYFPDEALEQPALEWIQKPLASGSSIDTSNTSARFDLSGNILTEEAARDLPVTRGLHHHGDEAGRAGYTLSEVLMLSSSTYGPQRVMMLGLLGKIVANLDETLSGLETLGMTVEEARKKAFLLACGILGSKEKNLGLLREAITILLAVLETSRTEEVVRLTSLVELNSVLTRIQDLLEEPILTSRLSAPSILQLISSLDILATTSTLLARAVSHQVPQLLGNFVLTLHWPDLNRNSPVSWEIAMVTMSVLRECTEKHRDLAITFTGKNVYTAMLKFLALPPWEARTVGEPLEGHSYELVGRVLELFEGVARYGLQGRLVTRSGEIFTSIGEWLQGLDGATLASSEAVVRIAAAYFELARTWTVAATDPHSMGNDHELIWSQIEGYAWTGEAVHCLELAWRSTASGTPFGLVEARLTTATINLLAAWVDGATINTVKPTLWTEPIRKAAARLEIATWAATQEDKLSSPSTGVLGILDSWSRLASQLKVQSGIADLSSGSKGSPIIVGSASGRRLLGHQLLISPRDDARIWAMSACSLLAAAQQGEEQEMLKLVDILLDLDWKSGIQSSLNHRHGLYILRPFYQCAILPSLSSMISPVHPTGKIMKVSTSLKPDPLAETRGGLPLPHDWALGPLNDQLRPTTSLAFKQVPPAWEASAVELAQASLATTRLLLDAGGLVLDRSTLLFNLMKVFMLELAVDPEEETRVEVFRDPVVSASLSSLAETMLAPGSTLDSTSLEIVSEPFLAPATTFFQWYSDFLDLYLSVSFSDRVFGQLLLPPLAQNYPVDYRRLFWSEQTGALRAMRLPMDQVPLEYGSIKSYFCPPEEDRDVLAGYLTALAKGAVTSTTHEFLYALAIWHVASAIWSEGSALSAKQVRGALSAAVWDDIARCDCSVDRTEFGVASSKMDNVDIEGRLAKIAI